ncbi:TonB family protein [Jiulongibacter sp. NS-SX5]|uniref:TonB family protein n=1 Tax=Jiulongibacter sp. NS-SX5 TaxID=3463854 RepID=UPI00405A358A
MNWLNYLFQVNLYLLVTVAFYLLVLRRETFFQLNRIFLLVASVLSFLIPFWKLGIVQNWFVTSQVTEVMAVINLQEFQVSGASPEKTVWSWELLAITVYFLGFAYGLLRFSVALFKLQQLLRINYLEGQAFSVFGKIFVDKDLPEYNTIRNHEEVHSKQFHSVDVFWFELVTTVCWFNPAVHWLRHEIKLLHELIADDKAAQYAGQYRYAEILVATHFKSNRNVLVNNFFNQKILKTRIMKLSQEKSSRTALLKYAFAMPLFIGMLIFSAASNASEVTKELFPVPNTLKIEEPVPQVASENGIKQNTLLKTKEITKPTKKSLVSSDTTYAKVEQIPEFPGGTKAMFKFIGENLKYPEAAQKEGIEGRVFVKFVVKKDGSIGETKILKDLGAGTGEETIRVIKSFPRWNPGKQDDKPVAVWFTMPVFFKLDAAKDLEIKKVGSPKVGLNQIPVSPDNTLPSLEKNTNPLYFVNGEEVLSVDHIEPDQIASISVMKGEKAIKHSGNRGGNGIVFINLK